MVKKLLARHAVAHLVVKRQHCIINRKRESEFRHVVSYHAPPRVSTSGEKPVVNIETAHSCIKLVEPSPTGPLWPCAVTRPGAVHVVSVRKFPGCRIADRRGAAAWFPVWPVM